MNINNFLLTTFLIGLSYSILAMLIERLLMRNGLVRGNSIGLVIGTFFFAAVMQLVDYNGSVLLYGLIIILCGPIAVNRDDLIKTSKKGKWWWKQEKEE